MPSPSRWRGNVDPSRLDSIANDSVEPLCSGSYAETGRVPTVKEGSDGTHGKECVLLHAEIREAVRRAGIRPGEMGVSVG